VKADSDSTKSELPYKEIGGWLPDFRHRDVTEYALGDAYPGGGLAYICTGRNLAFCMTAANDQ